LATKIKTPTALAQITVNNVELSFYALSSFYLLWLKLFSFFFFLFNRYPAVY
jgi:hypothetical protein